MTTQHEPTQAEKLEHIRNGLTDKGWVDDIGSTRGNTIEVISFLVSIIDDIQASNKSALDRVVEVEAQRDMSCGVANSLMDLIKQTAEDDEVIETASLLMTKEILTGAERAAENALKAAFLDQIELILVDVSRQQCEPGNQVVNNVYKLKLAHMHLEAESDIKAETIHELRKERDGALSAYNVTKSDLDKAVAANRSLEAGYKEMEQQRNNLLANQRMMQLALNDWAKDVEALKQALLTVRACGYLAESEERVIDGVLNAH